MKIKLRYENKFQTIELSVNEACKWLNIDVSNDKEVFEIDIQNKVQKWIDETFNKPEYNIYHRETRYIGVPKKPFRKDEDNQFLGDIMDTFADNSQMIEYNNKEEFIAIKHWLESFLKPEEVEMFMTIEIEGISIKDYAVLKDVKPNTMTKRLIRLKNKIKKGKTCHI
ncbi:hypothetical protein [Lactococcus raffinolactis]|uniref:hypothetical protein n=1 Tax=Pseudolactococcus raffinolactis TaxID=1366 RepID=UPI0039AFF842